jgi:hypothetical protein
MISSDFKLLGLEAYQRSDPKLEKPSLVLALTWWIGERKVLNNLIGRVKVVDYFA